MFEWDDARFFLALHRGGSLSSAGRTLGVNQSTVGRRIRALEDALGARLFVQTEDGYVASPAGERLIARAEGMEEAAVALQREATGEEGRLAGTVRVTGADAFGARILAPLLAEFHRRFPKIDVELLAENKTLCLTRREADMAIRTLKPREPLVVIRRICDFGSGLYASQGYLAANGTPAGGDYEGHAFVGVDEPAWEESLWLAKNAPSARVAFKTNSTFAQLEATKEGMGLGVLPCYLADAEAGLVRVLPPEQVVVRQIWIALHKDLAGSPRMRACADFLVQEIGARADSFMGRPAPIRAVPTLAPPIAPPLAPPLASRGASKKARVSPSR